MSTQSLYGCTPVAPYTDITVRVHSGRTAQGKKKFQYGCTPVAPYIMIITQEHNSIQCGCTPVAPYIMNYLNCMHSFNLIIMQQLARGYFGPSELLQELAPPFAQPTLLCKRGGGR